MISQPAIAALTKHPWLLEANTELLSLRISKSLRNAINQKAEESSEVINTLVRKVLIEGFDPDATPTTNAIAPPPPPPPNDFESFANPKVIEAIRSVARSIEQGSIECTAQGIINHFTSFCPEE